MKYFNATIREQGRTQPAVKPKREQVPAIAIEPDDGLNKTERAYRDHLDFRQRAGEVRSYLTHAVKFVIGKTCTYTPEFLVVENDGTITIIEIKGGHIYEDSVIKFKAAQKMFPFFRWRMIQRTKEGWKTIRD